jgi:hypothetical protein
LAGRAGDWKWSRDEKVKSALTVLNNQRNFPACSDDWRIRESRCDKELLSQHFLQALLNFHQVGIGIRAAGYTANEHVAGPFVEQLAKAQGSCALQALIESAR